jgi:hypothetical protein
MLGIETSLAMGGAAGLSERLPTVIALAGTGREVEEVPMRCLPRRVADWADRCLQNRPLWTLAWLIALGIAADFLLLWGIHAAFDALHQATAWSATSRPAGDVARRLERIERRLDEIGTIIAGIRP